MDPNTSSLGLERFTYFLNQVQIILDKATVSENPALLIYQENIRTPFFMLEALTRTYKKIYAKKIFKLLNCYFKEMEDSLGSIDYYDGFYKEFSTKRNVPSFVIDYILEKKNEHLTTLNVVLVKNKWIGKNQKRIRKIFKNLNKVWWLPEIEDTLEVKKVYTKYISAIANKFKNNDIHFDSIELDVHELRRELRWLNIYPQALRGLMQLRVNAQSPEILKKYLTTEIITSPYNIMADGSNLKDHIILNADYFYSLSWMISELGKLKDNGLKIIIIKDALIELLNIMQPQADELAYSICGETQMSIPDILESSKIITTTFFDENILENLVG